MTNTVKNIPGFWMNETSGVLQPAVMRYLKREPLWPQDLLALRAYIRQWVAGDFRGGEELEALRRGVDEIESTADLDAWLERAVDLGIDPF